jgi:hypothetical protein
MLSFEMGAGVPRTAKKANDSLAACQPQLFTFYLLLLFTDVYLLQ